MEDLVASYSLIIRDARANIIFADLLILCMVKKTSCFFNFVFFNLPQIINGEN